VAPGETEKGKWRKNIPLIFKGKSWVRVCAESTCKAERWDGYDIGGKFDEKKLQEEMERILSEVLDKEVKIRTSKPIREWIIKGANWNRIKAEVNSNISAEINDIPPGIFSSAEGRRKGEGDWYFFIVYENTKSSVLVFVFRC